MKRSERPKASKREDGDGVDFISNMPDAILVSILSRVESTEEVIRSSILSTRWRYLWTAIPSLDIETRYRDKKSEFKEFVYWVLANKTVDLDSFRLCCFNYYSMSTLWRWIHITITRNIKQLNLSFCTKDKENEDIELPHCLVTCGSLEVLRLDLRGCGLSLPNFKFKGFPALRVLALTNVDLLTDGDLVKKFLESCLLLEELSLLDCDIYRLDHLCISCPKLKTLSIINREREGCEDIRISCPKLVDLDLQGYIACNVFFDCLNSLKKFVYEPRFESNTGPVLFHGNSPVKPLWMDLFFLGECIDGACDLALPHLKTLVLRTNMRAFTVGELIQILKYCSKLESLKLTIKQQDFDWPEEWDLHEGDARRIMTPDVKRMEFFEFNGEKPKVDIDWCSPWDELEIVYSWGN